MSSQEKVLKLFESSPLVWGMYYFPHHFRDKSPLFHKHILDASYKNRFFAVAAPRGSAKSTILTFLKVIHRIVFKEKRFVVIVQNTYQKASVSLETIKHEIKNNEDLKRDFPIEVRKDREGDTIFRHPDGFECRVLCKGAEQIGAVRGEKFGAYRPDYILIDDLEDDVMVRSPEGRENIRELYDKALIEAGDAHALDVDAIGTILHDDCLIARLVSSQHYKQYHKMLYRALNTDADGQFFSLWPERWTVEQLKAFEKRDPTTFAQEMQNDPVSGVMGSFSKDDWRYWYIEQGEAILLDRDGRVTTKYRLTDCKAAIACDLAWEEKKRADETVIMPALFTPNSEVLIDTYIHEKGMKPDRFEEYIFPMEEKYRKMTGKSVPIGFEKARLEKVMTWLLKKAMKERNQALFFRPLQWDKDKITRIVTRLQARYKNQMIFHRKGMGDLEYQLLRIPHGTHDDLADSAQGVVQLFNTAPSVSQETDLSEDRGFEWLMKNAVQKPKQPKETYIFGKKARPIFQIPAKKSYR